MSLAAMWAALGESPSDLERVRDRGSEVPLVATLPVGQFVHDAIAASSLSAALLASRSGRPTPSVDLDPVRVATAVTSERHFRLRGEPMDAWAELSGFWPTADGWVRTHANYPHHRERLLRALGLPESTDGDGLRAALATRDAASVEQAVCDVGGIATEVRSEAGWGEHPHSAVVAKQSLLAVDRVGDAPPAAGPSPTGAAPLAGIRVLDLTRVIAGPVASRTLALWGADVLRIDPPNLPEIQWQHLDTGAGKRSAVLAAEDARFSDLVDTADVILTGYRPGSLDRFGLTTDRLVERRPGVVVARLSAWGSPGPLAQRRAFDSIVQAATGIAWVESTDGEHPGALPAQALDHSAGYLLAAAITTAVRRRFETGGSWSVETSLARIARELLAAPRETWNRPSEFVPSVAHAGGVTVAAPAAHFDGGRTDWPAAPVDWGSSPATWIPR